MVAITHGSTVWWFVSFFFLKHPRSTGWPLLTIMSLELVIAKLSWKELNSGEYSDPRRFGERLRAAVICAMQHHHQNDFAWLRCLIGSSVMFLFSLLFSPLLFHSLWRADWSQRLDSHSIHEPHRSVHVNLGKGPDCRSGPALIIMKYSGSPNVLDCPDERPVIFRTSFWCAWPLE